MTEVSEQMFQSTPDIAALIRGPVAGASVMSNATEKAEGAAFDPRDPHEEADGAEVPVPTESFGIAIGIERTNPAIAQAFGQLSLDLTVGEDMPPTPPVDLPANAGPTAGDLAGSIAAAAQQHVIAAPAGQLPDPNAPIAAATLDEAPPPSDPGTAFAPAPELLPGRKEARTDQRDVTEAANEPGRHSEVGAPHLQDAAHAISGDSPPEPRHSASFAALPPKAPEGAFDAAPTPHDTPGDALTGVSDAEPSAAPDSAPRNAGEQRLIHDALSDAPQTEARLKTGPSAGPGDSVTESAIRFLWQDLAPQEHPKGDLPAIATGTTDRSTARNAPPPTAPEAASSADFVPDAKNAPVVLQQSLEARPAKPEEPPKGQKHAIETKRGAVAAEQRFGAEHLSGAAQADPAFESLSPSLQPSGPNMNERSDNLLPAAGLSVAAPSHAHEGERFAASFAPQTPVKQVVHTIANNLHLSPGQMDLTLTPDTLGPVHFEMRPEQNGLSITLSAENPDTLDLMRRHLPDLIAELKQAGIQTGNFSFSSWQDRRPAATPPPFEAVEPEFSTPLAPMPPLRPASPAPMGALDLRV